MEELEKLRRATKDLGRGLLKRPLWEGPTVVSSTKGADRQKESFRQEWSEALSYLANIGEQLRDIRPPWVKEDVPLAWQIDQFLHAYYYNKVGEGLAKPFEEFFVKNRKNPQAAVSAALAWWGATTSPPSHENETFYVTAPRIRECLSKDKVLNLSDSEFRDVVSMTHATRDHVIKIDLATLGRPDLKTMSRDERLPLYSNWLLRQRNDKGWDVKKLLHYVLYGGGKHNLWERLYQAGRDPEYQISHYGLNSFAEVVGWAQPEMSPPRNGRTSKALRALGFDVRIY